MRGAATVAAALLALFALPATARPPEDRAALLQLQADDLRLQAIGWRLAAGNAAFCDAKPAIGLLVQDMASYGAPAAYRAAAGIVGDIAVQAAVPGSPAARAGLAPNTEILSIDGRATADLPPAPANDWKRLAGLNAAIDAALAANGAVRIGWRDAGGTEHEASIAGMPACPTRFELLDGGSGRASADGTRVLIGRKFAGMGYAEDELAAALAHEFAHNLLAHRAWLRAEGRNRKTVRLTEDEADRLMPWLLANAGYDPAAAVRFFERWGPGNDGGLFRNRNHSGWDERAEAVTAEIARLVPLRDAQGSADWRTHFVRTAVR